MLCKYFVGDSKDVPSNTMVRHFSIRNHRLNSSQGPAHREIRAGVGCLSEHLCESLSTLLRRKTHHPHLKGKVYFGSKSLAKPGRKGPKGRVWRGNRTGVRSVLLGHPATCSPTRPRLPTTLRASPQSSPVVR